MSISCQIFACLTIAFGLFLPLPVVSIHAQSQEPKVSFVNEIMPILTKAGCNAGLCHAKAGGGQNGFELSLLGFEPDEDFEHLVKEGRGRRLFPAAPTQSLLLLKATASVPHGGGRRFDVGSMEYQTILKWIEQGSPDSDKSDRVFESILVTPAKSTLLPDATQALKVIAKYSDGSSLDVTRLALFETNNDAMAICDESGLVTAQNVPGKVSIMIRYQGKVAVYSASIPLGAEVKTLPKENNFVDRVLFGNLKTLGIPPSEVCDDSTFLRRASIDIAGRLPTEKETTAFLASDEKDKREKLVDALLSTSSYADYFANKWTSVLKNRRDDNNDITANFAFHAWIRDSLLENKPYDQLVRELLAATGTIIANPPVAWYKRVKEPKDQLEDVAQLFLGVRMQCAQCHHHPFERWSQDDYYSFSAFFSRIGRKPTATRGEDMIFHQRGIAEQKNVRSGEMLRPAALGDSVGDIPADEDPRLRLANWMADQNNPFFAKALVNRYWKHFFRRGLIEPEDDIRDTNPPSNPELLIALEKYFVENKFDLKKLIRVMVNSTAYQLSATPNEHNLVDRQNYSRYYPKRMQAEVMLDAIDMLTGSKTNFANLPSGTSAVALPDTSYNKQSPFLKVFGRPGGASVCECERVQSSNLAQSLHLINSRDIKNKLAAGGGRVNQLSKQKISLEEKIETIYKVAFSRSPSADELKIALEYLREPVLDKNNKPLSDHLAQKSNLEDLVWALINSKEFFFNH